MQHYIASRVCILKGINFEEQGRAHNASRTKGWRGRPAVLNPNEVLVAFGDMKDAKNRMFCSLVWEPRTWPQSDNVASHLKYLEMRVELVYLELCFFTVLCLLRKINESFFLWQKKNESRDRPLKKGHDWEERARTVEKQNTCGFC